jgi:threonyl-tRNA synthetase
VDINGRTITATVVDSNSGAFYGPKIDITISDALRRKHQCATIQLDFQLPERFNLHYRTDDPNNQYARPVMIHRAILGSVERMIAILAENYGGKWPFWLSPRQVVVIPISEANDAYAKKVQRTLHAAGIYSEADLSMHQLKKKVRNAEIAHINYVLVVGDEEEKNGAVNVRSRDSPGIKGRGEVRSLEAVVDELLALKRNKL